MTQPSNTPQASTGAAFQQHQLEMLVHLNARAMQAQKPAELQFSIVNETIQLSTYRQAAYFNITHGRQPKLAAASGLVSVDENSPYTVWLNDFAKCFTGLTEAKTLSLNNAKADHQEFWQEWLPEHLLVIPLQNAKQKILGYAMYAREAAWSEPEVAQMAYLHHNYSYCMNNLLHAKKSSFFSLAKLFSRKSFILLTACLAALMLVPMRLSTLAPSEVIALNAFSVAAPQDGVIQSFAVQPNSIVKQGDILFTLDDTSISNRYEVAKKALSIAKADALVFEQRAFDDTKSKGELASAMGRVREKEAELNAINALRARIEIRAERDGIAIFSDVNDWIGRPVQTGERVIQIADPQDAGLLVWLPVKDALNIELGAPMKLFLHTDPLHPIVAKLQQTSYQASMSPENVSSYRLKGMFDDTKNLPRIGLRGTTRISGDWSILGYYLFRRPIASVREWTGL